MHELLQKKLARYIAKDSKSQCWVWTGQITNSGYGRVMMKDENGVTRMESALDASYRAFNKSIPDGMMLRQTCHNRLCVNPDHLELFTPSIASN